jgi:hypothetical protein
LDEWDLRGAVVAFVRKRFSEIQYLKATISDQQDAAMRRKLACLNLVNGGDPAACPFETIRVEMVMDPCRLFSATCLESSSL